MLDPILTSPLDTDLNNLSSKQKQKLVHRRVLKAFKLLKINTNKFNTVIHVIGSTGKGTTAILLSQILKQCGYNVGVIVKPHLASVCERFNLNGKTPNIAKIKRIYSKIVSAIRKVGYIPYPARAFLTSILYLNSTDQLDFLIVEAGIGAKNDYTDVFRNHKNYINIITSIEKLHKGLLGNTKYEIATLKFSLVSYTKYSFLLQPTKDQKIQNLAQKYKNLQTIDILPSISAGLIGSRVECQQKIYLTNLTVLQHIITLCKLLQIVRKLTKCKLNKQKLHFYIPARASMHVINKAPVIIDNSHSTQQVKNLVKNLTIFNNFNLPIRILGATRRFGIYKYLKKLDRPNIDTVFPGVDKIGFFTNKVPKTQRTGLEKELFSSNAINVITGSVYWAGAIMQKYKISANFLSTKSLKKYIYSQKTFARIIIKHELESFKNSKEFILQSKQINNSVLKFLSSNLVFINKLALFLPLKYEPQINIENLVQLAYTHKINIFLPILSKTWKIAKINPTKLLLLLYKKKLTYNANFIKLGVVQEVYTGFYKAGFTKNFIILLPGLAFDNYCNRLGHGYGIYDKLLKKIHNFKCIFPWQLSKFQANVNYNSIIVPIIFKWQKLPYIPAGNW